MWHPETTSSVRTLGKCNSLPSLACFFFFLISFLGTLPPKYQHLMFLGAYQAISDSARSQNVLSTSVRWAKTICSGSCAPEPIIKCHESHVSGIGAILILDNSAPSLNAISRDKKSASVREAGGTTNFNPI